MKKQQKYEDLNAGIDFVPFAIETSGVWGEQAMELVTKIGRRIAEVNHDPRSTSFLRQRISVAPIENSFTTSFQLRQDLLHHNDGIGIQARKRFIQK